MSDALRKSYEQDCRVCGSRVLGAIDGTRLGGRPVWLEVSTTDVTVTDVVVFAGPSAQRHICKQKGTTS